VPPPKRSILPDAAPESEIVMLTLFAASALCVLGAAVLPKVFRMLGRR
jgi:hypothetical protein